MIMNALNGVWSETYTLKIIIKKELEKLTKILQKMLILKIKFPIKMREIYNIGKKNKKMSFLFAGSYCSRNNKNLR